MNLNKQVIFYIILYQLFPQMTAKNHILFETLIIKISQIVKI